MKAFEWNIEGLANLVIKAMKEDDSDIVALGDYVHNIAFLTVYSRKPKDASVVAGLVTSKVLEKYEQEGKFKTV